MNLLRVLRGLSRVRVSARALDGTRLRGDGDVAVQWAADGSVVVSETGTWCDRRGQRYRFSNAYRWRVTGEEMRLSHERQGAGFAVELVELVRTGPRGWHSPVPHACGGDLYSADVRITDSGIVLRWRVCGPRKMQLLRSVYRSH